MGNEKLLQRMQNTKAGWKPRDLERLYDSFGFEKREGAKHTRYQHPSFPWLIATVPRHKSISPRYVGTAIRLVGEYKKLATGEELEKEAQ